MMQAVFISDLHLGPDEPEIVQRFLRFSDWARQNTESLYILGDFFHAWPGDDIDEAWIQPISTALKQMAQSGIRVFFLAGNRDFLVGKKFCRSHSITLLKEPTIINLGNTKTLLVHGDVYCTRDKKHQWFRKLTRNPFFINVFTLLPFGIRQRIVSGVRAHSQSNKIHQLKTGEAVPKAVIKHLKKLKSSAVIHGHTHKPALHKQVDNEQIIMRYVLSDWDDNPIILCYDKSKGYNFVHFGDGVI